MQPMLFFLLVTFFNSTTRQYVCGTCGILFDTSHVVGASYMGVGSGDVNR